MIPGEIPDTRPAQTLTDIQNLLRTHGLLPKKRLGQNFLHDANHMDQVVAAARVGEGHVVLEVGAGTGSLSRRLLDAGARLVAVEIDADLEPILRQQLVEPFGGRVTLVIGDVLTGKHVISLVVLDALASIGAAKFKLVANLPYNIASPLLVNLAVDHPGMTDAVVMVQREVAARLAAGPGTKVYGPLGVIVQAMCEVELIATLAPTCFWPNPQVESAVIRLTRRSRPLTADPARFGAFIHKVLHTPPKQLGTILGRDLNWPAGVEPVTRPEQLSIQQLVALCDAVG
ncbi:MAG: 16S rRNA (adenine(1518)-N(6)/adenine(1519)-N(6))-dimethyltransferase RsmA [Phycisphaeraceae bacterium]|nr:16S rRNA (adenine(1518)-N(6)/adenine(1519)-N(6))-dimethyltransferase RsmA [Phycisphaeraceae bacterium]